MFNVGKTLGCIMPGFTKNSNDIAGFNPPILSLGLPAFLGVSFTPPLADVCGAELAAVGAAEVAVLVWLWGSDSFDSVATGASTGGADTSCGVCIC
jgi:hypothetical protein